MMQSERTYLAHDWYGGGVPGNVRLGKNVYLDTSHSFAAFLSERDPGLILGDGVGVYDRTTLVVGRQGRVRVGAYTCLNATYVICHDHVNVGAHCFLAWGSVITDSWLRPDGSLEERSALLRGLGADPNRPFPRFSETRPVTLEDNAWVGFESVVLPGVTLGRGCVVGCKTVVAADVPPYAVVVGNPPRVVRYLAADDDDEVRMTALRECLRAT